MIGYRVRPFDQLNALQHEMNKAFNSFNHQNDEECSGSWAPAVDIKESKDAFILFLELPGMKKEEIKISIRDNSLSVSGEKMRPEEKEGESYHRIERSYGPFCRTFKLPSGIETGKTDALFNDGILKIVLNKAEEQKPQEIKIN